MTIRNNRSYDGNVNNRMDKRKSPHRRHRVSAGVKKGFISNLKRPGKHDNAKLAGDIFDGILDEMMEP